MPQCREACRRLFLSPPALPSTPALVTDSGLRGYFTEVCSGSKAGSYLRLISLNARLESNKEEEEGVDELRVWGAAFDWRVTFASRTSSSLLLSSLDLGDTQVYEPQIRALLGTSTCDCDSGTRVYGQD